MVTKKKAVKAKPKTPAKAKAKAKKSRERYGALFLEVFDNDTGGLNLNIGNTQVGHGGFEGCPCADGVGSAKFLPGQRFRLVRVSKMPSDKEAEDWMDKH